MSRYTKFHEIDENPETNQHLAEIVKSISENGWVGLPLLACGDQLLTGCHRATACEIIDVEPEVHQLQIACTWGDDDYTDMLLDDLSDAGNARTLLKVLKTLHAEGLVDNLSVKIMQAVCDKE